MEEIWVVIWEPKHFIFTFNILFSIFIPSVFQFTQSSANMFIYIYCFVIISLAS